MARYAGERIAESIVVALFARLDGGDEVEEVVHDARQELLDEIQMHYDNDPKLRAKMNLVGIEEKSIEELTQLLAVIQSGWLKLDKAEQEKLRIQHKNRNNPNFIGVKIPEKQQMTEAQRIQARLNVVEAKIQRILNNSNQGSSMNDGGKLADLEDKKRKLQRQMKALK